MDLAAHERAERAIHELMPREAALAGKLGRHDARRKMRVVVRLHEHLRAGQPGANEAREFFRVHGRDIIWVARARAYNDRHGFAPGRSGRPRAGWRRTAARLRTARLRYRSLTG